MKQREFIKGYHISLKLEDKKITDANLLNDTEYHWEVPENWIGRFKKGDLVVVVVKKRNSNNLGKSVVLVDEVFNDSERVKDLDLKFAEVKYNPKKSRVIKRYLKLNKNKEEQEKFLVVALATKCNLSERSIASLLKKYDEEKVKRAVDMYLATEDRKAPLKFLKFILEKIS